MPIDTEQWRAQTGLFCASRVLLRPPRGKQPQPKVQGDTLDLNMRFTLAVLLVTLRTGISRTLQLLWLITCTASWLLSSIVRLSCRRLRGVSVLLALCLVVVQMLLIMSGDVEENPGPIRATPLGVSDLSCVREELLDVSHKWFDIGLKLKLKVGILECVREQYSEPSTALREMLLHWLKKVDPPPTWEGLACALESRTVGEPRLAEQLRTKYCTTEGAAGGSVKQTAAVAIEKGRHSQPVRRTHSLRPTAPRSYIPRPITRKGVPAGGLVRGKLQTVSTTEKLPHHSQHTREVPPSKKLPSHIPRPIARKEVDPVVQQRKPLPVRQQTPAARSPIYGPVPPSSALTPVDRYASYLRSVYTSKKLPTYSKWPPTATKKYVHLAVVKKEKVSKQEADEFTKSTMHGNIDDICKRKQAVDFTQIGRKEDGTSSKLILVEGGPGIGKTTFAWKLCRKWAKGKILQEYGVVVLLRLRDKRVQEIKCVADLFYHSDHELQQSVSKEIQHHDGKSVLLLFEGFDELPRKLRTHQSTFLDVLHKNSLPHATILITSRPSATEFLQWHFKQQISQHIEILGFTKDDIISYVHDTIKDEQVCKDFFQYLKCYPYIHGMMYVPLNAVIVTEVYKSSRQSPEEFIPTTITELYTALTRSLLLRYLLSHSEYGQQQVGTLKKFSDLPKELYERFNFICKVALKGMIEDTFVHEDLPHDFNTLDLMQSVPELYVEQGASISYSFFHLTLQEFLAAMSISQQPVEKQVYFIEGSMYLDPHLQQLHSKYQRVLRRDEDARFQNVQRFVAGLTRYENISPDSLKPVVLEWDGDHVASISLNSLHWLFEARCINIFSELVRNVTSLRYNSSRTSMAPLDCFVLGYALSHITFTGHWKIDISRCHIDDECVEMLVGGVNFMSSTGLKGVRITKLVMSHNTITEGGATTLAVLKGNGVLQQLNVSHCCIGDGVVTALADMLKGIRMLQQLDISNNSIGDGGATTLAEMLKGNQMLEQLDVSQNCIGAGGATTLAEMLKGNRMLQRLDLSKNSIGDGGATALVEVLKENRTLQQLNVESNSIGSGGATILTEMLKENTILQNLDLHYNFIGNEGATALAEILKENTTLQQLNVGNNSIGNEGATALAEMLKENTTLLQLDVSLNSIGYVGTAALAEMLKENKTLQQLNVSYNSIGDEGATVLAEKLKNNTALQQLEVVYNSIGDGGATALAEMLKENRTLQQLNVSYNFIGDEGATTLAKMLKENTTLQRLDFTNNSIGDGGATALAEMLKETTTLQQLNVSSNLISNKGATALAEMLKTNTTLQLLDFEYNSIGDEGATALTEMLKENTTLQKLHENYSYIGDEGATSLEVMLEDRAFHLDVCLKLQRGRRATLLHVSEMLKENTLLQLDISQSLNDCDITALTEILKENTTLQQLNISYNCIGTGGATALGKMLKENVTLQQLDVYGNCLGNVGVTGLVEFLKENTTLQQLNVGCNSIGNGGATALAEMLKENSTLQQLDVSHNSIGNEGVTTLAEILKENTTLQQLNVGFNSIGDGGATALAEMLKENRTLQQLNVSRNSIGDGATVLAEMLKENRTLQQLDVSSCSMGSESITTLIESLQESSTLLQLNVTSNFLGSGGATALAGVLEKNVTLQQLNVSTNSIGSVGTTALAEMLKENRTLQQLNVCFNSIGNGGTTALVEVLKENRTLQQLNVGTNSIGDGGATALAQVLKENTTLQYLNVSLNSIGSGGVTALAEMLKENVTLLQLDVSFNSIGSRGVTPLAKMLKENMTLQQLDVSRNSIGNEGATALAEFLKENRSLQQLNVSRNSIRDGGATALAEMLKENTTLQQLNVSFNSIGSEGATALVEMLKENTTLLQLDISFNFMGYEKNTALAEMLRKNRTLQKLKF